jgi:anti-anti-sigma factor
MEIREQSLHGILIVEVVGRVDSTAAPAVQERFASLLTTPERRILLDLTALDYISSAGFRVLLIAGKHADQQGIRIALCGMSEKVRQLFDLAGFLDLFSIAPTRQDGIALLGPK